MPDTPSPVSPLPFDGERAAELLLDAAERLEQHGAATQCHCQDIAGELRLLRDALPALLDARKDAQAIDFLTTHCSAVTLQDSVGTLREFERWYFSPDDSFRDFLAQLPAEYERVTEEEPADVHP